VRWTVASVLGRLAGSGNARALAQLLNDPATRVRKEAAISLGYLGDATAAVALEDAANDDSDPAVRAAAADSLKLLAP
jgi:HEAT repeat protein